MLVAEREHCFVLVESSAFVFHTCFLRGMGLSVSPKLDNK